MKFITTLLLILVFQLAAQDGIIVAVNNRYMKDFYPALAWLRFKLKCDLPIQVWHSGGELSQRAISRLEKFSDIEFCDIATIKGGDPKEYRGYQIKPLILKETKFDRVVLIDADVYLFVNPKELFELKQFVSTGAFFFRDTYFETFKGKETTGNLRYSWEVYKNRKKFYLKHIQQPGPCMPEEWLYMWKGPEPSLKQPQLAEFMESGVVVIDKTRHERGINEIVKLNEEWRTVYNFILGDKETFWMGMEMAGEPYYVNEKFPYLLRRRYKIAKNFEKKKIDLIHHVEGKLIYQQKTPLAIDDQGYYYYPDTKDEMINVPEKDLRQLEELRYYYEMYRYREK